MKKLVFALVLFMSVFFAQAQVSISLNIGTPPSWGPEGNDNSRYYYLPDIDTYYDVAQRQYIYDNNGRWIRESRLPARYRQYDLYKGYKVVLNDYKGDTPNIYHNKHRENYPKGYHGKPQKNRGNKPEKNNSDHRNENSKNYNGNSHNDKKHSHDDHH
jgi:hypothetical protein